MIKKSMKKNGRIVNQAENKKGNRIVRRLTKNILEKTYDSSAIAFIVLASLGKTSLNIFLKPTYYMDDSSDFIGEINSFKQRQVEEKKIKQAISRLQEYGLVRQFGGEEYSLSLKGKELKEKILGYKEKLEEEWDKKYRLVIFDIPEVDRRHRDWLRQELYFLGYTKLQNSVFISKISLTEELIREIKERGIGEGVNYLLVEHVYDLNNQKMNTNIQ